MFELRRPMGLIAAAAGLALGGCVAAVPVQTDFTVIPGEGKTEADLRADDVRCRQPLPAVAATATAPAIPAAPASAERYYACMAARGQAVIQQQVRTYPAYADYGYPVYPAYGYPYYGYGYPYGGYYGPYVGFGVGFGYGGFYGGRGYYGGFRGGYGGGFRGGFHR